MLNSNFIVKAGKYQKKVDEVLEKIKNERIVERIWQKDFSVWSDKPDEIVNRLGWLYSTETTRQALAEIYSFVDEVRKDRFTDAIVLGMGGSSMAPEVFSLMFGTKKGYLNLHILDSTDPGAVLEFDRKLNPSKTLFIVSTKSGGTVETFSFMKHFYNKTLKKIGKEKAGKHFAAITDPGSGLVDIAEKLNFRKIFKNDPDIGGRYSALSFFGMVPAALCGVELERILESADKILSETKSQNVLVDTAAYLGSVIGSLANEGVDKVTFVTPGKISFFGAWVEQLIAESTGKNGKGILPVEGETLLAPKFYLDDRLFVYIHLKNSKKDSEKVSALNESGHPVVEIAWNDLYDLGMEYFRWEFAVAIAGWAIGIHPFDQPNVEAAKILAREMVKEYQEKGKLPELKKSFSEKGISVVTDVKAVNLKEALSEFFHSLNIGENGFKGRSYVSIQAYVKPTEEITSALQKFRTAIQKKYKIAATVSYGPRFLHSTGQLHKGDGGHGLFIQLTSEMPKDIPIPDNAGEDKSSISFGTLKDAQALGDRQALLDNKRRVIRFNLGRNITGSLKILTASIK